MKILKISEGFKVVRLYLTFQSTFTYKKEENIKDEFTEKSVLVSFWSNFEAFVSMRSSRSTDFRTIHRFMNLFKVNGVTPVGGLLPSCCTLLTLNSIDVCVHQISHTPQTQ